MRHPNHRLVKTHRTYTVEEIASLFHVHRNTVDESPGPSVNSDFQHEVPTHDKAQPE